MFIENHRITFGERFSNFLGITGSHLTDTDQLAHLAINLDLPDHAQDILGVKEKRKKIRALETLSQLAGLSTIVALSSITSSEHINPVTLGVGIGTGLLYSYLRSKIGKLSTSNQSTLIQEMTTLAGEVDHINIGEQGIEASKALNLGAGVTDEERMLYARPKELIVSEALQWLALISTSSEPMGTAMVGLVNTTLSAAQSWFVTHLFTPANQAFIKAYQAYALRPKDDVARRAYEIAKERKAKATEPINFTSSLLGQLILVVSKLPVNTTVAGLLAKSMGTFTNIAGRSIAITHAREVQNNLRSKVGEAIRELALFIKSPDSLANHIKNHPSVDPLDLINKVRAHNLTDALLIDAQVEYPEFKGRHHQLVLDFSVNKLKILAGGNGSGKTTLRRLVTHEVDNHSGYTGIVLPTGEIKNIHDMSFHEIKAAFPYWAYTTNNQSAHPLSGINNDRLRQISYIKGLEWIADQRILESDASSTVHLSNGERRILSIISFVENHHENAHTLWLDEVFAELHPSKINALIEYFRSTGSRFILIQQNPSTESEWGQNDLIFLTEESTPSESYYDLQESKIIARKIFFESSASDVQHNPLYLERIWESNTARLIRLLADNNADAIQLVISCKQIFAEKPGVNLLRVLQAGLIDYLEDTFSTPDDNWRLPIEKSELVTLSKAFEVLSNILPYADPNYQNTNFIVDRLASMLSLDSSSSHESIKLLTGFMRNIKDSSDPEIKFLRSYYDKLISILVNQLVSGFYRKSFKVENIV